ncbi:MAG: pyruvate kinase, partial [Cetobacterium sp.]
MKKTKIVCTIGPKTESVEVLSQLLEAGMNVMRMNFSHGS